MLLPLKIVKWTKPMQLYWNCSRYTFVDRLLHFLGSIYFDRKNYDGYAKFKEAFLNCKNRMIVQQF